MGTKRNYCFFKTQKAILGSADGLATGDWLGNQVCSWRQQEKLAPSVDLMPPKKAFFISVIIDFHRIILMDCDPK